MPTITIISIWIDPFPIPSSKLSRQFQWHFSFSTTKCDFKTIELTLFETFSLKNRTQFDLIIDTEFFFRIKLNIIEDFTAIIPHWNLDKKSTRITWNVVKIQPKTTEIETTMRFFVCSNLAPKWVVSNSDINSMKKSKSSGEENHKRKSPYKWNILNNWMNQSMNQIDSLMDLSVKRHYPVVGEPGPTS